jgi:hypothetical protein
MPVWSYFCQPKYDSHSELFGDDPPNSIAKELSSLYGGFTKKYVASISFFWPV